VSVDRQALSLVRLNFFCSGRRYLAHNIPDLSWVCLMKVRSREFWEVWRATVLGTLLIIFVEPV